MVKQVLEGHTALGRTKRTRIVVILTCLFLCGASLIDLEAKPEYKPINEALDQIRLRSEGPIQVLHDASVPRDRLYSILPYGTWFENKHLWIHVQGVVVNQVALGVLYVEFRTCEEAEEGLERRLKGDSIGLVLEGRRFGRFAIFVSRPSNAPENTVEMIFSAWESRRNGNRAPASPPQKSIVTGA